MKSLMRCTASSWRDCSRRLRLRWIPGGAPACTARCSWTMFLDDLFKPLVIWDGPIWPTNMFQGVKTTRIGPGCEGTHCHCVALAWDKLQQLLLWLFAIESSWSGGHVRSVHYYCGIIRHTIAASCSCSATKNIYQATNSIRQLPSGKQT